MPAAEKKAILGRLPGFFFSPGAVFQSEVSEQVYEALLGDYRSLTREEARVRARDSVTELFTAAMGQAFLYQALRGGPIAWELIANSAILHGELDAHEAQVAVEVLLTARRAFTGRKADDLTALVDQFARIVDEAAALGPVRTISLAVYSGNPGNSSQTASHESTAIIDSLADAMRELHIQHPWPPAYFNERELLILAQTPVARALAGVDPDHRDHVTDTADPVASSRGSPLGIQIALCRHALAHYRPTSDWALFISPVGFRDRPASQAWFHVLGPHHAKAFATVPVFFSAAAEALTTRRKKFALAMLMHWYRVPGFVVAAAGSSGAVPSDTWLNGVRTQRFASTMIFRRVKMGKGKADRIQIVWYDPWKHTAEIKEQAKPHAMAVFGYRNAMVDVVRRWARESGTTIHSCYWGGYGSMDPDIAGESVKLCLAYLERIGSGETMAEMFPDPEDEEGFGEMGFTLSE